MENNLTIETFYKELQLNFNDIKTLKTWKEWDWSVDSYEHSVVMADLARQIVKWANENQENLAKKALELIDKNEINGSNTLKAFLSTDFYPTLFEELKATKTKDQVVALLDSNQLSHLKYSW